MFSDFFYISSALFVLVYLAGMAIRSLTNKRSGSTYHAEEITVLIPFRNEEKNLSVLISGILALKKMPGKFVFMDDHSDDGSMNRLKELDGRVGYEVVQLRAGEYGKKNAIRRGVERVETRFFLTWDADIRIPAAYFIEVESLGIADLAVLPVRMKSTKPSHFFYELDYYFLNAVSFGLSSLLKPIVASGSNLLINKEKFEQFDSFPGHRHIQSGDDMFTLVDFKKHHASISLSSDCGLIVETRTPDNFREFLKQRVRWIQKAGQLKDPISTLIGFFGFAFQVFFMIALIREKSLLLIGAKILGDVVVLLPYLFVLKRTVMLLLIPVFSVIYPIYVLCMPLLALFYKPTWKNRAL